jgi:hypothetical protein
MTMMSLTRSLATMTMMTRRRKTTRRTKAMLHLCSLLWLT